MMTLGCPEELGHNPPSSVFQFTFFRAPDPLAAEQPHSTKLQLPCLTVLKASSSPFQTYCWSFWFGRN